jgi:hypothetical protein
MLFSQNQYIQASMHPDYSSHFSPNSDLSCEAYGSLRDYFGEISDGLFDIEPALTHPGETDPIYRTGIANPIKVINGTRYIESIKMKRVKYGVDPNTSYFYNYGIYHEYNDISNLLLNDARDVLIEAYVNENIEFDVREFDGMVVYIFAGGHAAIKGYARYSDNSAVVRGMYNNIYSTEGVIDGITCMAHEIAHIAFQWSHTISGTNCLMNGEQKKDINCPSHPNPIFKLKEGWLSGVHLSSNQNQIVLPPVETGKQAGIVTIYGNPQGAPDHLAGECYIIENRRTIGFDRRLMKKGSFGYFKGGILIWHYSPYTQFSVPNPIADDPSIKLITPVFFSNEAISGSPGNPLFYFAYNNNPLPEYKTLFSNETYSQENVYTGIEISEISQAIEITEFSNMTFKLNYTISPPPVYGYTILNFRGTTTGNKVSHLNGRVFFHKPNSFEYFRIYPGARIDVAPEKEFRVKGIIAEGDVNNKIIIGSTGYSNANESYMCSFKGTGTSRYEIYGEIDKATYKNIQFLNTKNETAEISIDQGNTSVPVEIESIFTDNHVPEGVEDIKIIRTLLNKFTANELNLIFVQNTVAPNSSITSANSRVEFRTINKFGLNSKVEFNNCDISATVSSTSFIQKDAGSIWKGIKILGGGLIFTGVSIKGAEIGLSAHQVNRDLKISNCTFDNINKDIEIDDYVHNEVAENGKINNNFFTPTTQINGPIHIDINNTPYIYIGNNTMNNILSTGIAVTNCVNPIITSNTITGGPGSATYGYYSYLSGGEINCNSISACFYGLLLDNSQPLLYQNDINTNGIGMFLSNNSIPIMSPAYTANQTSYLAGYNHIYNNSGYEIYLFNTINSNNNLLMDNGYNSIEDNLSNDYLIYIENSGGGIPEMIDCRNNYWGNVTDPGSRLYPQEYFNYLPFLITLPAPPTSCQYATVNADNSTMNPQTLMLGNALTESYEGDYNTASALYNQMITNNGSLTYKKTNARQYYKNVCLDTFGINSLPGFYQNLMFNNDTLLKKYYRGLKIESQVTAIDYQTALHSLDSIIQSPSNNYELLYSNIEKLRILTMLDSSAGGDNSGIGLGNINTNEILYLLNSRSFILPLKYDTPGKNTNDKRREKKAYMKTNQLFSYLLTRNPDITGCINNISPNELKDIMKNKIMFEILSNNYLEGVPPIRSEFGTEKIKNHNENTEPLKFELRQNYPNPFNPVTNIKYSIPSDAFVTLSVYDITGRLVKSVTSEYKRAGNYFVTVSMFGLASGIYFYRIQAGRNTDTKRMIYIK